MAVTSGAVLSGEAAKARANERRTREKNNSLLVAPATISSHFHRPRAPLLVCAPQQNCHASQARIAVVALARGLSPLSLSVPFTPPTIFCCFLKRSGSVKTRTDLKIIKDGWKEIKRKMKVAFQGFFPHHFVALSTAHWEISFLPFFFGFGVYKNFLQIHPCTLELHLDGT